MPCNSDHLEPTARELESKKVMAFLGEVGLRKGLIPSYGNVGALNEHTAQLCKFCQENDVSEYSLELQIWWRNHQAADKRKAEIKLAKNKEEKEKRAALAKLTPYERKLLGL